MMKTTTRLILIPFLATLAISGCKKDGSRGSENAAENTGPQTPPAPRASVVGGQPETPPGAAAPANPHAAGAPAPANPHTAGAPPDNPHAGATPTNPQVGAVMPPGGMGGPPPPYEPTAAGQRKILGGMSFVVPEGWAESAPKSGMRRAQWTLSAGKKTAELVVYYFGPNGAGSVEANLDRWIAQVQQEGGKSSKEVAKIAKNSFGGLAATTVDVTGRYFAAMTPGATEMVDKSGQRLLGAIVDSPQGPYYFKLLGDAEAVNANEKKFWDALKSAQPVK